MFKIKTVKNFINTKFRDKIVDVLPPRECWTKYDGQCVVESYVVTVKYKYAGDKEKCFYVEDEQDINDMFYFYSEEDKKRLHMVFQQQTLQYAQAFYGQVRDQICLDNKKKNL